MGFIDKIKDKSNVVYDVHDKRLRPVTELDSGKIVGVNQDGEFELREETKELPPHTQSDAGKVVIVDENGDYVLDEGGGVSQLMTEITMQELYELKQSSELVPGMWYRITDYAPTYSGNNYHMAGHQFDIIILATGNNSIASQCYFVKHEGDVYFANNDLSKWKGEFVLEMLSSSLVISGTHNHYSHDYQISGCTYDRSGDITVDGIYYYCITSWSFNGPGASIGTRYVTAGVNKVFEYISDEMIEDTAFTITNVIVPTLLSYGYVDKLIDEFNNECPYDFKNVLYKTVVAYPGRTYTNAYTFSQYATDVYDSTVDASLLSSNEVYNNKIIYKLSNIILPQNVFLGYYCSNNTFGNSCKNNTFGSNCSGNTFGSSCDDNTFGNNFRNNTFGNSCYGNTFSYYCSNNTFGNSCNNNTFGESCGGNTFGNNCYGNTFGNSCNNNTFDDYCYSNTFGGGCNSNTFVYNCNNNTFGNNCEYNTFGNNCNNNTFGDNSSTIDYVKNIILDNECSYLEILSDDLVASGDNYLQNIHIHSGVQGTDQDRLTISVPDRNLPYSIDYYAAGSQDIVIGGSN